MRSNIALVAQGSSLALCVIPCHPCMRTCVWLLECSLFTRLSTSSSSPSSTSSWCLPWCLTRIPWKIPCATPASGAWSAWTMSHPDTGYEPKEMELSDRNERNLATSSDVYFQNALEDTASFPNVPDVDDDELAEFLAVVVDRTGQPVEVRSNGDQFSCDIRNLKSAQSQFPLVTQPRRMINQTGGSVEERIAEERESSNAQIRTLLNEQRKTIIAEYCEKVSHHELLAAQAEQDRKILQEELLRQQQDFREVHQQDLMKQKELQKFQNSTFDELTRQKFIEDQKIIMELSGRLQELQNEVNCMNDSKDFRDAESICSGNSHVTSPPGLFPGHPPFEGLLKSAFISQRHSEEPPNIRDTSGKSGNVFAHPQTSSSAPYPQELNSTWRKTFEEPIHMSTAEKSGRPERDPDLRCQSGPSAKDSVIFSGGDSSKKYGADQQRLQISDLHFDKFRTPATFACWKTRFKTEVCTCSQFPTEAMLWIKDVAMVESLDDLKSSRSIKGTLGPDFELLDARIASALNKIIQKPLQEKSQSGRNESSQRRPIPSRKTDRLLDLRIILGHGRQWFRRELCRPIYSCSSKWWYSGIRFKMRRNSITDDTNPIWWHLGKLVQIKSMRVWETQDRIGIVQYGDSQERQIENNGKKKCRAKFENEEFWSQKRKLWDKRRGQESGDKTAWTKKSRRLLAMES